MSGSAPGVARREPVVLRVRAHARRLVLPMLVVVAGAGAAGFWGGSLPDAWMNLAVWVGFGVLVLLGVSAWLRWLMCRTVITSSRVILYRGVLVQHRSDVPFAQVREVRMRRSLWQQLFRTGNVLLITGGPAPVVLRDVPNGDQVCDALRELIERHYAASLEVGVPAGAPTVSDGGASVSAPVMGVFAPERAAGQPGAGIADTVRVSGSQPPGFSNGRFTRAN